MNKPRIGTIIWGAALLLFAALAFAVAVFDLREIPTSITAWVVTGLGGVFVVAAVVALIARAATRGAVSTASTTGEPTETDQPVD
jgi:nitrate reductase gamma subunit